MATRGALKYRRHRPGNLVGCAANTGATAVIKNVALWEAWERDYLRKESADFARNLALLDAMYEHARLLGAFPPCNPLEGLEVKIQMARVLNVPAASRTDRPQP